MAHDYLTDLKLYIDGERLGVAGRAVHRVVNPVTGGTLGELPLATSQDLDRALDTAARGYRLWRAHSAHDRSRVLAGASRLLRQRIDTTEDKKAFFQTNAQTVFGLQQLRTNVITRNSLVLPMPLQQCGPGDSLKIPARFAGSIAVPEPSWRAQP
jgi:hypothetical protein